MYVNYNYWRKYAQCTHHVHVYTIIALSSRAETYRLFYFYNISKLQSNKSMSYMIKRKNTLLLLKILSLLKFKKK